MCLLAYPVDLGELGLSPGRLIGIVIFEGQTHKVAVCRAKPAGQPYQYRFSALIKRASPVIIARSSLAV